MRIRTATPDDADTILAFIQALADYEREPDAVETDAATLRAQLAADHPPFECVLAEEPVGMALGLALFFPTYSTWRGKPRLWLEDLFVPVAHRGRGVGRALIAHVAALAVARGCARFEWSVLDWNEPAIRFYEALGARPQSEWTTYRITHDALDALAASAG